MMNRERLLGTLSALVSVLVALASGCDGATSDGGGDSETHFLGTCDGDGCAAGLECICGVCTRACDDTAGCADLRADAECNDSCQASGVPEKVCGIRGGAGAGGSAGGGSGGSGATSGSGGTSGQDSACLADPVAASPDLTPAELDADEVARAAIVIGACNPDDGVDRNAAHIWGGDLRPPVFYVRTGQQARCLANANCGCAAIDRCLGFALEASTECTPGCTGDVFTICGGALDVPEGYLYRIDCGKVGLSCDSEFGCVDGPAVACDSATATPSCNAAGQPEVCSSDLLQHGPLCADLGLECVAGACVFGAGEACTNQGVSDPGDTLIEGLSCSGDLLEACVGDTLGSVDCTARGPGFGCQSVDGTFFCGLASECIPADDYSASASHPGSCDGTVFTFCNAGRLEHIDCLSLGFTGCEVDRSIGHYGCIPGLEL